MKRIGVAVIASIISLQSTAQDQYQLAPPLVKYGSLIYKGRTTVQCAFNQPGTSIRYTIDGSEPVATSKLYTGPVPISGKLVQFKTKVFGTRFQPSETVECQFIQQGLPIQTITGTVPHPKYKANGLSTLHDGKGGLADIGNQQWLGYEGDTATLIVRLPEASNVSEVLLHCLQQESSWIMLPQKIEVYSGDGNGAYNLIGKLETAPPAQGRSAGVQALRVALQKKLRTRQLKIICYPLLQLPAWHSGAGSKAWMFTDEIIVY